MRIFWHEGGLHIHPESEHEGRMLVELVDRVKFEKPPEMQGFVSSGSSSSGECLFDRLVANHDVRPSGFSGKSHDKQTVIPIHKLP